MTEKIALVTGSGKGIGRDIALRLASTVSGVAVHFFMDRKAAQETVSLVMDAGATGESFQADLTVEDEAFHLVHQVEEVFGRIDLLINNVGPIQVKPWADTESEDWDRILSGNLKTSFFCMKAVLPGMRQRGWGRIINLGYSRVEHLGAFPTVTPYAVAKTGLLILTRTVAKTEAGSGITVNMVSPGLIEGGVLPTFHKVPQGRLGTFADVSSAMAFLVSDEADYITGTNLVVAGGWKL